MRAGRRTGAALAAAVAVLVGAVAGGARPAEAAAADAKVEKALEKVEKALDKSVKVSWKALDVSACLKDLSRIGRVKITLDAGLPGSIGETPVNYTAVDVPLAVALGNALHAAELRYAVTDAGILVSTQGRLARKLVYGEEVPVESSPMTRQDALAVLSRKDMEQEEEAFTLGDPAFTIDSRPERLQERPRYNPDTGLTDYPAPPIWLLGDDDINDANFRYSINPYFETPQEIVRQGGRRGGRGTSDREMLAYVVELMAENPDLFRKIVKEMEKKGR